MRATPSQVAAARRHSPRPIVLAYHAVTPNWQHPLAIHPERFRRQLTTLASRGFHGVTFAVAARTQEPHAVCITFDDAFASSLEWAVPVLDELRWPATVFPVVKPATTGEPMRWLELAPSAASDRDLTSMSWPDLQKLSALGWEIGSHGLTHRLLSDLDDDELDEELVGSRDEIVKRIGSCTSISYPWGEVHQRVVAAARRSGYTAASGLAGRFRSSNPMAVPRFAVSGTDGPIRYRLKTSRWFWGLRSTPAWSWLDAARHRPAVQ